MSQSQSSGAADSIVVPSRQELLDRLKRANQFVWISVPTQVLLIVFLVLVIDWPKVVQNLWLPIIAVTAMIGSTLQGVLMFSLGAKKEIGKIREDAKFGEFDKYRLRELYKNTLDKLGLPDEGLPVYITPDKTLNAGALHLGLAGLVKSLNGIYLNRQILHKLEADEVQDTMGHELGHYYRHYLLGERFRIITLTLGGLVGIFVAQWLDMTDVFTFGILSVCAWVFWFISSLPHARNIRAIEFLCDDFGAQVNGVVVSINSLLKLGADAELQLAILHKTVLANKDSRLNASELVEGILEAIPYGHASREELEKAVENSLKKRSAQVKKTSIAGLIRYLWIGDGDGDAKAELLEQAKQLAKLQSQPRLQWETLLSDPSRIRLNEDQVEQLVAMMERNPSLPLFRVQTTAEQGADEHPPLEARILYLWKNRREIEQEKPHLRRLATSRF